MEDSPAASHLVVFEDRAEMDSVIKYLMGTSSQTRHQVGCRL